MSGFGSFGGLSVGNRALPLVGLGFLAYALAAGSLAAGLVGLGAFGWFVWRLYSLRQLRAGEPWQWPPKLRATAEGMARRIDPTPERILPADPDLPDMARVETTAEGLTRLLDTRPPQWRWAVFASVLVQRRNAIQPRLRSCASGYQPEDGTQLDGVGYARLAQRRMEEVLDLVVQTEQFMLSPAFTGAFGEPDNGDTADGESIVHNANRLMDYHEDFVECAEHCLQTPVEFGVIPFAQDVGAMMMCPLIGYDDFIVTMCARVAEMEEIAPYGQGRPIELEPAMLVIDLPDGLMERITGHFKKLGS